jgi:GNAT superfamily N-acetyltransferase
MIQISRPYRQLKTIQKYARMAVYNQLYGHSPDYLARQVFKNIYLNAGTEIIYKIKIFRAVFDDNQMVGWGIVVNNGWIWRYVKPKFRNQGVGTKLIKLLTKDYGKKTMW